MRSSLCKAITLVGACLALFVSTAGSALGATFSIGGKLSGLNKGSSVTLLNGGKDALSLTADGSFNFSVKLSAGASYDVTVHTQPKGQICTVAGGTGTVAKANVTSVKVTCADAFTIGGTVSGLDVKDKLILLDNGGDSLTIETLASSTKPVPFTFKTPIAEGDAYDVTVGTPPTDQVCAVAKAAGTVAKASVTSVAVTCKKGYTVGGTITELAKGRSITLSDNGGNLLTIAGTTSGKANFTFTDALANAASYNVKIATQPAGETCSVAKASGKIASANVTDVGVSCKLNPLTIGGAVNGLKKSSRLVLLDNNTNALTIVGDGASSQKFTFTAGLAKGASYDVTVETQPAGQVCSVKNGAGVVGTADVTNVAVTCSTGYTVGGTVAGLKTGLTITLENNGGDALTLHGSASGTVPFTFSADLANNADYAVSVSAAPAGESCKVSNGAGKIASKSVTNVAIACSPTTTTTYSIGGTISWPASGVTGSVTLTTNSESVTVPAGTTPFTFPTKLATNTKYSVSVTTQPTGGTCSVTGGASGTIVSANITNVAVTCTATSATTYTIGGNVSGLNSGAQVVLQDNLSDNLTVTGTSVASVGFTFKTALATGAKYSVTVLTQPSGETCTVTGGGSGTVGSANVTNVAVSCTAPAIYTVGGNVSGLTSGQVTLLNEGGDSLSTGNGSFMFTTKLANGAPYDVTVSAAPSGMSCSVANGSGKIASASVTNVAVTCSSGSGGGGNAFWIPYEAKSLSAFSLGGTVSWPASGVSGSVFLEVNSGDLVTVTYPTTSFTFPTNVSTGTQYGITVAFQPTGGTCTVTGGATGVVNTSDITNIAVTCTASPSAGGEAEPRSLGSRRAAKPSSNLLTGHAKPFLSPDTSEAGSTGLFVIPSDKISSSPAPTWITTDTAKIHAIGLNIVFGSGGLTTYIPKLIVYSDTDFSGITKIYGLDISNTAATPTPVQISSLALDSTQEICSGTQGQVSLSDPTTIFVLLDIAPVGTCNFGSSDTFEVVHYTDSSSTAPMTVSLDTNDFNELYNNGTQSGIIVFDDVAQTVNLYADESFTNPKTLFSGISFANAEETGIAKKGYATETSDLYYEATTTGSTTPPVPPVSTLYLIDSSGTATSVFTGPVGSTATDDNNFYFVSTTGSTSTDTSTLYQVALGDVKYSKLYTGPATITTGTPSQTYALDYELTGSNDSLLIFETAYGDLLSGNSSTTLYHVPVGTTTTMPTTIATYPNAGVSAFLGTPSSGNVADDVLFVSIETGAVIDSIPSFAWSSIAFPAGGPYTGTPLTKSFYGDLGILTSSAGGTTWRVKGITETKGGLDGGTFYLTNIGTLADTAVTTTGGGNYSFPLPTSTTDNGYQGALLGLSNFGVAVGDFLDLSGDSDGPDIGVAIDTTKNFLYPITLPNTDVFF